MSKGIFPRRVFWFMLFLSAVLLPVRAGVFLQGDFNKDLRVGLDDLGQLAEYWLNETTSGFAGTDLNRDHIVDLRDFALFASNWQRQQSPLIISEFMASNGNTLEDADGDSSDWIEIYNLSGQPVNLQGWYLTDNKKKKRKWKFPAVIMAPGQFLVVFASGKDRAPTEGELHTNFQLAADGEYLALVMPDGKTTASEYDPVYPPQVRDVSYGITAQVDTLAPLHTGASGRLLVPADDSHESDWMLPGFNDSDWDGVVTGIGFSSGQAGCAPVAPAAYWSMDDQEQGTTVADMSGHGHDGTLINGPAWTEGISGSALQFDGIDDVVEVPYDAALHTPSFTLAAWVKPLSGGSGYRTVISGRDEPPTSGFILYATPDNLWQFWTGNGGGWDILSPGAPAAAVKPDQWQHLAVTFRQTGQNDDIILGEKIFYIDGVEVGRSSDAALLLCPRNNLRIGAGRNESATPAYFFPGSIDEVAIFDTVLTAEEIACLAQGNPPYAASYNNLIQTDIRDRLWNINSSLYLRLPFNLDNTADIDALQLQVRYDDGFIAYLNGQEIARRNAPETLTWQSAATVEQPYAEAVKPETIDVSGYLDTLQPGENILALQGLNVRADDDDFLLVPELYARGLSRFGDSERYFIVPSPGKENGVGQTDLGPLIRQVSHTPRLPGDDDDIIVTAVIEPTFKALDVASILCHYRIMYEPKQSIVMTDDGLQDDALAGDGIYTAVIPAAAAGPGQMVRYFITAADIAGHVSRWPLLSNSPDAAQFCGTMIADPSVTSTMPIFFWFTNNPSSSHTRTGARASVFFNGEFYDNIFVRQRGQATNAYSQKFVFHRGHRFHVNDILGAVKEINLNANGADPSYIRQSLAFETHGNAGVPSCISFPLLMQLNGSFDRVGVFIEQVDEQFLQRNNLDPTGALYKFVQRRNLDPVFHDVTTGVEKKTRKDEDFSDIQAVVDGLNAPTAEQRKRFIFDNFNLPEMVSYLAARCVMEDTDDVRKNFYFYRDTNGTGEWSIFPWDKDFTFGVLGDGGEYAPHPFFGDYAHLKQNAHQWSVFLDTMFNLPEVRQMYLRRLRSVMDELLQPANTPTDELRFESRVNQLYADISPHINISSAISGVRNFFPQRRSTLYGTYGPAGSEPLIPPSQEPSTELVFNATLIPGEPGATSVRYYVPVDDRLGNSWRDVDFADDDFSTGAVGIGYERHPSNTINYTDLIKTDVNTKMAGHTSIYIRIEFDVADTSQYDVLQLRMKYDDGYIAWLNGQEVARRFFDGEPAWNSAASSGRSDSQCIIFEDVILSPELLREGRNVLAIQGLNTSPTSSDLLILPKLRAGSYITTQPDMQVNFGTIEFNPSSGNQDEEYIELVNPGDTAVDISGWKLSGAVDFTFRPGTVIVSGGTLYISPDVNAFRARSISPRGGQGLFVQGNYKGHLSSWGETVYLKNREGKLIATVTYPGAPTATQRYLRITEIMYNPPAGGTYDNQEYEFIELKNIGSEPLLLDGVKFTQGINYTFAADGGLYLAGGGYIILVRNRTAFAERYAISQLDIAPGQYSGYLDNGGEKIKLEDNTNSTILEFSYKDSWYPATDGGGFSLVIEDDTAPPASWNDKNSFAAGVHLLGTPGTGE